MERDEHRSNCMSTAIFGHQRWRLRGICICGMRCSQTGISSLFSQVMSLGFSHSQPVIASDDVVLSFGHLKCACNSLRG